MITEQPMNDSGPADREMVHLADWIEAHADEPITLERLGRRVGLSRYALQRRFSAALGVTPSQYQRAARVRRVKRELRAGRDVAGAVFEAGFGALSRFYDLSPAALGMTPLKYRRFGAGEQIRYASRRTRLGWLTMAATHKGVCYAQFGDSRAQAESALFEEFGQAEIQRSEAERSPALDGWMDALETTIDLAVPEPDIPLHVFGTALQIRTWRFLSGLARGTTASYSEVAAGVGRPKAVRAVAGACAANRIALLIPCHRVLRSDGKLGGYRWGLERKQALLAAER